MSTPSTESDPYAQYGGYEAYMAAWTQYYASAGAVGAEQGQQDNNTASSSGSGSVSGAASNKNVSSRGDGQYSGGGSQFSRNSHSVTASSTNNIPLGVRNSAGPSSGASAPAVPVGKSEDTIYINGLPPSVTVVAIAEYFGTVGIIKTDKKLRPPGPKIWIYRDKATQLPKGDATLTYEDPPAASAAITFFNGKPFRGGSGEPLLVQLADAPAGAVKFAESGGNDRRGGFGGRGGGRGGGGSGGYGRGSGGG
ncbi:TATA-binding protein-associated factor 2N, partial [Physocladia obscura]